MVDRQSTGKTLVTNRPATRTKAAKASSLWTAVCSRAMEFLDHPEADPHKKHVHLFRGLALLQPVSRGQYFYTNLVHGSGT